MNKIVMIFSLLLVGLATYAQKIEDRRFSANSNTKLILELNYARDIKINAGLGNEVRFKAVASIQTQSGKSMVELLSWDISEESNLIEIHSKLPEELMKKYNGFGSCEHNWGQDNTGKRLCVNISYEIWMPAGTSLEVKTYSGNIELKGLSGPVYAKTLSGYVDADWDSSKGAYFELKSISGEVYEGLGVEIKNRKKNPIVGYEVKASYKNGGVSLHLESISGDVFLRKAG